MGVSLLERGQVALALLLDASSTLRELYPDLEAIQDLDEETRLVVSEPLRDLPGAWNEVPESSYGIIQPGQDELLTFTPAA